MNIVDMVRRAAWLLDTGVLMKHDESFVSAVVTKFDKGNTLAAQEVSRLRDILDANE